MYLSPTEEDRLRIFVAAELARRTEPIVALPVLAGELPA